VVCGFKPGRKNDDDITVFDSTGLAIQDMALAQCAYRRAVERGLGQHVDLF
jgi:ornithine cyclodeaminase/alanine dehydrogenase-like protein (mu-crystallin family)